jgi:NitT/TauT family transport system substrate-binding protein
MAALVAVPLLGGCQRPPQHESKPVVAAAVEEVTLCRSSTVVVPVVVAMQQGLFSGQGVHVTTREFTMGRETLEAMLQGGCDFAIAAEPPVVEYALAGKDFRIISALQSSENFCRLVARADQGIAQPADLRGKRIATAKGTAPHYFLDLFLQKYRLSNEVQIEFLKADALLGALTSGRVDAIAMTNTVITQAQQALQAKAITFEAPGLYRSYYMLLAPAPLLEKRPAVAVKFLQALARAAEFIQQRPDAAQALIAGEQKISLAESKHLWQTYDFRISLDHPLLMGLEDTARWHLQQTGNSRPVPNFINWIHTASLAGIRPEAVNLVK